MWFVSVSNRTYVVVTLPFRLGWKTRRDPLVVVDARRHTLETSLPDPSLTRDTWGRVRGGPRESWILQDSVAAGVSALRACRKKVPVFLPRGGTVFVSDKVCATLWDAARRLIYISTPKPADTRAVTVRPDMVGLCCLAHEYPLSGTRLARV